MRNSDADYFKLAQELAVTRSTCLKIKNGVVIVNKGRVVGQGFGLCSPSGFKHGKKVKKCERINLPTGVGYDLCRSVHAEVVAISRTRPQDLNGATLYLAGHYYPCWHCESLARLMGIKKIKVKDLGAKKFYKSKWSKK